MAGRWTKRMERLGAANRKAREEALESLTLENAARVLEGLLAHPLAPPTRRRGHPVSLSRRMRGRHV
jgi:hypothetical protein